MIFFNKMILIFLIVSSLNAKNIEDFQNKYNFKKHGNRILNSFNGDFTDSLAYSYTLIQRNERKTNFNFCVNLINNAIDKYGEDSIYTKVSYLILARYYLSVSDLDAAENLLSFTKATIENTKYEKDISLNYIIYMVNANHAENSGKYQTAYHLYLTAMKFNKKLYPNDETTKLYILNPLTSLSIKLAKYDEALKYVKEAMKIEKTIMPSEIMCTTIDTFINYSNIYKSLEDYNKSIVIMAAIIALYDGVKKIKKTNDLPCILGAYIEYSTQLASIGYYKKAIDIAMMFIHTQRELGIKYSAFTVTNLNTIAYSQKMMKNYDKAKKTYQEAIDTLNDIHLDANSKKQYKLELIEELKELETLIKKDNNQTNASSVK